MTLAPPGPTASGGGSAWRDLGPRAASGLVMVALALISLWAGGRVFIAVWFIASAAVAWEWQAILGDRRVAARIGASVAALAIAAAFVVAHLFALALAALVCAALVVSALAQTRRVWSAAGVIYSGGALLPVCLLRGSIFDGVESVLWLFVVVWSSDAMAYFGGRAFGGPKIWPAVSPGKTWSGTLCGLICGAAFGWLALRLCHVALAAPMALALGALLALAAFAGDLFESWIKRRFGVKDSGQWIPGHGGAMDRLDGFIAAATLAAVIGVVRYGAASAALGLLLWQEK